jgi:hypothetical protein
MSKELIKELGGARWWLMRSTSHQVLLRIGAWLTAPFHGAGGSP